MTDLLPKICARLLRKAGFDGMAKVLDAGNLSVVRDMLPLVQECAAIARKTRPYRRNQTEKDTIAAADALSNLLQARAA